MAPANEPANTDPFDLERFVVAQDTGGSFVSALNEIRRGHKSTHWIWWVFPQLVGIGQSTISWHYAIKSIEEAQAYLDHPILGARLIEATEAMLAHVDTSAIALLGVDDVKFHASMTLFATASTTKSVFEYALDQFFAGIPDHLTQEMLDP
jgi:uncharacterized protein (DUF1810 family)